MTQSLTFPVENMSCGGCASRVSKALAQVPGAHDITVNFVEGTARLTLAEATGFDAVQSALATAGYPVKGETAQFAISGLSCASCVGRLEKALQAAPGVTDAQVNLADETARVSFVPGVTDALALAEVSAQAGYPAQAVSEITAEDRQAEKLAEVEKHRLTFLIAAALTLPVFILEMGGHLFPVWHHFIHQTIGLQASWVIQFLLTTAVLMGPGRGFFAKGLPALIRRAPTMDSLVALGAGAAWIFSTTALFAPAVLPQGTQAVYFEAAAVIVTLILMGRWFEARAKGQTGTAIRHLIGLQPRTAWVGSEGDWTEVPLAELKVGQTILLRPGARVPTDAIVVSGTSHVDESMISGEPMPVAKSAGDPLTGGSVNSNGSLTCRVTRVGADTTLSQIIRMVQQAQAARLPIQALVDQVTLWFVPGVIAIAVLTVVVWAIFGPEPVLSYALVAGVSVLIIACPCAMGLATPTSIMVGTGRAARLGVLFRQGDALQSLSGVSVLALDKTGTLTEGAPALTGLEVAEGYDAPDVLAKIAGLETVSEHPIARAIVAHAQEQGLPLPKADEVKIHTGSGIAGVVSGSQVAIGNAGLMKDVGVPAAPLQERYADKAQDGHTVIFAAIDGVLAAVLSVSDPVRPTTPAAIKALQARGLHIAMITGDAPQTAQAVAQSLGIETVVAGVLPDGKTKALKELRAQFGKVAFVGDGINDAPVLAEADVGIAIGTGTDVAIETADVVLMKGDLMGVHHAFDLSKRTLRNIKQNLVWAFGYNVLLIPVAAGVLFPAYGLLLSPGLAAGAMAFSSVFVLGNALRLRQAGGAT